MSPPIHKLPHDLLYYIFLTNTHHVHRRIPRNFNSAPTNQGLVTTRRCSQVCQEWRRIILSSSSLWGRLLDLNLLQQSTHHWREEVLRRTGTSAPIWITMTSYPEPIPQVVEDFLFKVMNEHWNRIEVLDILIEGKTAIAWTTGSDVFTRPAPTLREFSVRLEPLISSNGFISLPNSLSSARLRLSNGPPTVVEDQGR